MLAHLTACGRLAGGYRPLDPQSQPEERMGKCASPKNVRLELRCSADELSRWKQDAFVRGLSLSAFVRVCLDRGPALSRIARVDPELLRQIAAIGNNLNQIARRANSSFTGDWKQAEREMLAIRLALEKLLDAAGEVKC